MLSVIKSGAASTLDIIDRVKEALPRIAASLPPELADQAAGRPVGLRAGLDRRRGARGGHRRLPHGDDDPALPRQLAQHDDHRGLDPALDPDVDHRAQRARRDDQHHDARRPGARGRHPRGRRDGGDREHQLAPGAGQGARAGDPRRRRADRDPGVRLDALHLHRLRADVLPHRRRALPLRADGRGGGVRDARVLRAVADAGADDGEVPAEGARAARARRVARIRVRRASSGRSTAASCGCAPPTARTLERCLGERAALFAVGVPARSAASRSRCCPTSARTSFRRSTAASSSCTCARRPARASRRPRRCATPVDATIRDVIPTSAGREHHRQHRPALQRPQPVVQQLGADRRAGRRHPGRAARGPPADGGATSTTCGSSWPARFPACSSPSSRPTSSARS